MRNFKLLVGLSLIMALFIGCDNESADLQQEVNSEKRALEGISTPEKDKLTDDLLVELPSNRVPLNYEGQLCPGETSTGETAIGTRFDFFEGDFWFFTAEAGDVVTFEVNRTDCNSDPIMEAWFGTEYGDTDDFLIYLGFLDDEEAPACTPDCFAFGDPYLADWVVPFTGYYTLRVSEWGLASCVVGPMTYDIIISGQNTCTINIDGCDSGVFNQFVGDSNMDEMIDALEAGEYRNHGQFVSAVAQLVNSWYYGGLITLAEKDAIMECAGESGIPY